MDVSDLAYIDATGYHFSDYPTFLQWSQDTMRSIYGADIYLEPDSQDGQWTAALAKALYDSAARDGATYNSFSPATAQGVGLARNVKINGINKLSASFSTAIETIIGVAGTVITNGVVADNLAQKWNLPATVTIPDAGTIDVTITAQLIGAVNAAENTITTIFTPTRGWQTTNNAAAATPGEPVESDAELRIRQAQSTAIPSLTVFDGTNGAIQNVPGVTKEKGYENDTNSTDGNMIPAHSICCVVAGGDNTAIAQAIQIHKTPGTGTFGDTTVQVFDAHGMPLNIKFQRALTATISARVTISVGEGWSSDFEQLIIDAVAAALNAGEIGSTVLLTKLYAPAYLTGSPAGLTFDIASIELKKNAGSFVSTNIALDFDENPVCDPETDVEIVVT